MLQGDGDWIDTLPIQFRLLTVAVGSGGWDEARTLVSWMDRRWGNVPRLRRATGDLFYRNVKARSRTALVSIRNYLHERRVDALTIALQPDQQSVFEEAFPKGIRYRTRRISFGDLATRTRRFVAADLRLRDREDDRIGTLRKQARPDQWSRERELESLSGRFGTIARFTAVCKTLEDWAWALPAAQLFLSTRPPSYFDVSRRWLYRTTRDGFQPSDFADLLHVVNAVRGTNYRDPVGVVQDQFTVSVPRQIELSNGTVNPQLVLGDLPVEDSYWSGAARRIPSQKHGAPVHSQRRLDSLIDVLAQTDRLAGQRNGDKRKRPTLLVLPELAIPRDWFRALAHHAINGCKYGVVTGLEYLHAPANPCVINQVFAVLPGPYGTAASLAWTKTRPAREEAAQLDRCTPPVSFPSLPARDVVVVNSSYGQMSVLICSELLEARKVASLVGRSEVVLVPSWNLDTASYDHLIQSVGFQLHSFIAIANNGRYSDSRAWAPKTVRWERDLCRLIERNSDRVVSVELDLASLRRFRHNLPPIQVQEADVDSVRPSWRPMPPDWL